ncbi:MAG: aldehyde ferredoxin oxidoreductase family protein, partial [Promethearchaeota archaeon]
TEVKGFWNKILEINLSDNSVNVHELDLELVDKFLGGAGYAYATLIKEIDKDVDPLGKENILFFMGGPLLGTMGTSTGKMVVCAKSPITGLLGESTSGNLASVQLKRAGYDGLMIRGKAEKPVFIEINNDEVHIQSAEDLWGLGIYEAERKLLSREGWERAKAFVIGPAGENMVLYSIIGGNERAFGRTGMGAVMGSKNLKAIVIRGTKKVPLAEPEKFREKVKEVNEKLMGIFTNQMFQALGTSGGVNMYALSGELPVKYYSTSIFPEEDADKISGATLQEKYLKHPRFCYACPIGCGRVIDVDDKIKGVPSGELEGPEYETIAGFGSLLGNSDLDAIIKCNYMCNNYGMDTISTSSAIGLLMSLYTNKKIDAEKIDGLKLEWGAMEEVYKLIEKIAKKEGIGALCAKGSDAIGEAFNIDKEEIATIHHSDVPYHDMRSSNGMAIAYGISPHYGAMHTACDMFQTSLGQAHDEMEIESVPPHENSPEMAINSAKLMEYRAFYSAIIMCVFANPEASDLAQLLEYATGIKFNVEKIKKMGARILNLKRLMNIKLGHTPKDEHIPKILITPLPEGGTEGNVPDVDLLFSEFYKYERWDPTTGIPTDERLKELDLEDFKKYL